MDHNFQNHLAFLASHRGKVQQGENWIALEGDAPFLSFFAPDRGAVALPARCATVWTYPWSGDEWRERLTSAGFSRAERLAYMQLGPARPLAVPSRCAVERVTTVLGADSFADVQARGFLTDESAHRQWWADCFRRQARANHSRPDQSFWLARVDGEPAAVLLTVQTEGTSGIYAVATAPEHRRKGLSTQLLVRAIEEAGASSSLVLQVVAGSYAHAFYRKLGFEDQYECLVWRTP